MNPHALALGPSLIRKLNEKKRPGDIDLGLGEPVLAPDLAPFDEALEWTRLHGSPYSAHAGVPELRDAVAAYFAGDAWAAGAPTRDNVCITVGSEEAVYLGLKTALDPARDEVLVVEPCYPAYPRICALDGIPYRAVPLNPADGFRPRAEAVLAALSPATRMVVLNSPCNPTARTWPAEELEALARGLAAHHGTGGGAVYVLSDEVYRELYYGDAPASIARFHPHTLVAGSLSKSNALTGLRLGWLAGPREVIAQAIKVHQLVNTATATFAQRVALSLFAGGGLGAHRPAYLAARGALLAAAAAAGVRLIPPEGAFYALAELPAALRGDSVAAAEALLEEKRVVTVPGRAFGSSAEGWLRLSWVAPPAALEEGLRRMGAWMRERGS